MRDLTRVVGDHGNINIFTNYCYVHTEIRLQSSRIFLQIDRVAAILRVHCNRKLFTLNLMNFYYRELSHQNLKTDRSRGADYRNINVWTKQLLISTPRLI